VDRPHASHRSVRILTLFPFHSRSNLPTVVSAVASFQSLGLRHCLMHQECRPARFEPPLSVWSLAASPSSSSSHLLLHPPVLGTHDGRSGPSGGSAVEPSPLTPLHQSYLVCRFCHFRSLFFPEVSKLVDHWFTTCLRLSVVSFRKK